MSDEYELLVPGLRLWILLGCEKEERAFPQPVDIEIKINFLSEPLGCRTDRLQDVFCYQRITDVIREVTANKSFHLIESLAALIFDSVASRLDENASRLEIVVIKPNHPVKDVRMPIRFRYSKRLPWESL